MYQINWREIEEEGIRPITKTRRKHHYRIREGSALEGICFSLCFVCLILVMFLMAQ